MQYKQKMLEISSGLGTPAVFETLTWFPDIAAHQAEGNYQQVAAEVASIMEDYNTLLCQSLSGVVGGASQSQY